MSGLGRWCHPCVASRSARWLWGSPHPTMKGRSRPGRRSHESHKARPRACSGSPLPTESSADFSGWQLKPFVVWPSPGLSDLIARRVRRQLASKPDLFCPWPLTPRCLVLEFQAYTRTQSPAGAHSPQAPKPTLSVLTAALPAHVCCPSLDWERQFSLLPAAGPNSEEGIWGCAFR